MPFWRCYYPVAWTTKSREPLITLNLEPILFGAIEAKAKSLGCSLLGVNAVSDHIHAAVTIPPSLSIADWMKHVKGVSSREINEGQTDALARFRWQRGYGVLTFGQRNLPMILDYIARQKEHHAKGTTHAYMENAED